ncbi:DUF6461 domain-containing protein [Streptomyces cylindrosporus]|uniref:DUF6461 domain-containing protein n=1 Tax=Streptomyces cylindrosporus TaxID=2927583 RepID=A0ABS9YF10_9ACTN|nr:DUF6461 domain-containing protein [Streptomyces cylindrosporus]MCI3275813.1 DUF6461 domain-containing protein [Streptomyces cylindrosporus]
MTGRTPHARDYAWLRERHRSLREAYCITLVSEIAPEPLLQRLGAEAGTEVTGVGGLFEPAFDTWEEHQGRELFVAAAAVGGWSVLVEVNGYLGVTSAAVRPLSRGRTVVAHHRSVDALDHFIWLADGELILGFEPLFPYRREGSRAEAFAPRMRESGFLLCPGQDLDHQHTEAAFALAERITGIRLTADTLDSLEFVCGRAPAP